MTVARDLRAVRELLSEPERWTQGSAARSGDGGQRYWHERDACRWCLVGATNKVCSGDHRRVGRLLIALRVGAKPVARFNDTHTHAEVLTLLDRAIAHAETP